MKVCSIESCEKLVMARGVCSMHYSRLRRTGSFDNPEYVPTLCAHPDGCLNYTFGGAHGYCNLHYNRLLKTGSLGPVGYVDERRRSPFPSWRENDKGYIYSVIPKKERTGKTSKFLHREVMAAVLGRPLEEWENVHHKNGIKNDNRPANLELWVVMQPTGQRVEDMVAFVCQNYTEQVRELMNHG